jgi:hypothetical protein
MKVVSFCLYGALRHYQIGAIRNVELCKQVYPGWEIWIYASPTIPKNILTELKDKGATILIVEDNDGPFFMNYRFFPPADERVEYAIFRDTDSRVDEREAAAVNEWIKEGTGLHIMRDHPWHGPNLVAHMMLGGMWGVKCDKLRDVKELLLPQRIPCNHGYDQYLITSLIYPRFTNDKTVHDEIFEKKSWPLPRIKMKVNGYAGKEMYTFTGCQYDWDDQPKHPEHLGILEEYLIANNLLPK